MRRGFISLSSVIIGGLLAACGQGRSEATRQSSHRADKTSPSSRQQAVPLTARETALGLTRRLPRAYRRVCEKQAADAPAGARTCPPLIPAGPLKVAYRGRSLGRDSSEGGFSADLASRSLGQFAGKRVATNGGHWRYDVVWMPHVRRVVVDMGIRHPTNGSASSCRETRVATQHMLACKVVAHNRGGGVNGGHIAYVWDDSGVAYAISIHGYANEPRARAMMAALSTAAGG